LFRKLGHSWCPDCGLNAVVFSSCILEGAIADWTNSRELFLWAATIFTSRSFASTVALPQETGEPFPLLYPVIDIFNHRTGAKVVWDFQGGNYSLGLTEGIAEGEQIFNNYAPKGNEEREFTSTRNFGIPGCDHAAKTDV